MQRVRKGDLVQVIAGKEKGKRGKVLRILTKKDRVVVERLMMVKRHTKPSQKNPQGGILEREGSIHISNVMPIDSGTDKPTRVHHADGEGGSRRVAKSKATIEAQR